jgi:hypothetical protein
MIIDRWETIRVLILGTTYPSYSMKYSENACTGGLREDTLEMVRLHPIPHRYLQEESRFSAFQWIKVRVTKHLGDPRPESYRVDFTDIEAQEKISAGEFAVRRQYLERSPNLFGSLEELKERQKADGTSLGIVRPKEILGYRLEQ